MGALRTHPHQEGFEAFEQNKLIARNRPVSAFSTLSRVRHQVPDMTQGTIIGLQADCVSMTLEALKSAPGPCLGRAPQWRV